MTPRYQQYIYIHIYIYLCVSIGFHVDSFMGTVHVSRILDSTLSTTSFAAKESAGLNDLFSAPLLQRPFPAG